MTLLKSIIGRLRILSIVDALSYLYLLFCSIYFKRMLGDDTAIRIPGMIHGVIFCLYCVALFQAMEHKKWSLKTAFLVGLTSIIPFAPFWLEGWLKKQEASDQVTN